MLLNCLVVDDEPSARRILTGYIEKTPFLQLFASCENPLEALEIANAGSVDLIFLDIQMPQLSGLEFIKLHKSPAKVILSTAYSQHALESYELNVVDYLMKPCSFERFLQAAQKTRELIGISPARPEPTNYAAPPAAEEDHIYVKVDSRMQKVGFQDILYVEGLGNYVSIYTTTERLVTLLTMKEVEERLPEQLFMRIHRSYILSLAHIQYIEGNQVFIDKNTALPLGETYRERFFNILEGKTMGGRR